MKIKMKRFLRFFGPGLVLLELGVYFAFNKSPMARQMSALLFSVLNTAIVGRLAYLKAIVNKHNAKVDADIAARQAILNKANTAVQTPAAAATNKRTAEQPETPAHVQEYMPTPALA